MIDHFAFFKFDPVETSDKKICNDVTLMWYFLYLQLGMFLVRVIHSVDQRINVNSQLIIHCKN